MIPLQRIRDDPDAIRRGAQLKGEDAPVDEILALDAQARTLRAEAERLQAERNAAAKQIKGKPSDEQRERMQQLRQRVQELEAQLTELDAQIENLLLYVPNPPHESVPAGKGDEDNVTVRSWGEPKRFDFEPRPHYELGETLGMFDFERAAKISGARFALLRGQGPRLQRALALWFLDQAAQRGYEEVAPPYLVRREAMVGTANLPKFEDEAFHADDDLFLIPTAEVPLTNLYREEILDAAQLPIKHVAWTPCWRSEAGAAGKDTRGYIRMRQFEKVELVKFTTPETSLAEHEALVADAESLLQQLGLHYRVLLMCSGDMGFAQWKKYDLEVWCPGMQRFLEVSSCSVFADFQARRAGIRYRPAPGERPRFVHTLNGSALALPRTFDAVLETYQQADGSIVVPDVLRPYLAGTERISAGA
ncbi:MAG TPA: serine--tRNA ligase [Candidatus Angelobacter sp.]|jgi:seryl-tRNA synthetase|nr:serine--tRNA ligase [Candidatus Angelobacter sp.]